MSQGQNFTKGKILMPLVKFALPVLAAIFLQTMYGAVDMLVVGQFAQAADVSAVSTGSWLMQLVTAFVVGIAMGTTILLGRKIGEGRAEEGGRIIGASIMLFIIIGVVITVIMEAFAVPIARIMQTPPEAFDATVSYVRICSAGAVFIVAYNVIGSIFRGLGDSGCRFLRWRSPVCLILSGIYCWWVFSGLPLRGRPSPQCLLRC